MMLLDLPRPTNAIPPALGFNPLGLTDADVHPMWRLLNEGDPIQPGDGYFHPQAEMWIAYECRPDIYRGGPTGCPVREYVHTWPWRRKVGA